MVVGTFDDEGRCLKSVDLGVGHVGVVTVSPNAEQFIEEDLAVSVRASGLGPPSVEDGAQALWIMTVDVCRDAFPDGEIEEGPPVF